MGGTEVNNADFPEINMARAIAAHTLEIQIANTMNLRAIRVKDLSDKHRDMIAAAMPTQEEIDNDRWTEGAA